MKITRVGEALPAFYEGILRGVDFASPRFKLLDPITVERGRPLIPETVGRYSRLGPTDLLGFRNRGIPNVSDVVVIGDSHTFGLNVELDRTWPVLLQKKIDKSRVYNMSLGGWGALQYLAIFKKSLAFQPQVALVGIYSGNDALDTFTVAYASDYWKDHRIDSSLTIDDLPKFTFPPDDAEQWTYRESEGFSMTFVPEYRLLANNRQTKAVDVGYRIILQVIDEILEISERSKTKVFFTVFPSKELAYSRRILEYGGARSSGDRPRAFDELILAERKNISDIQQTVERRAPGRYIDLVGVIQAEAIRDNNLYPSDWDGHPAVDGQILIADTIASRLQGEVESLPNGIVLATIIEGLPQYFHVGDGRCFRFDSEESFRRSNFATYPVRPVSARMIQKCQSIVAESAPDPQFASREVIARIPKISLPD